MLGREGSVESLRRGMGIETLKGIGILQGERVLTDRPKGGSIQ